MLNDPNGVCQTILEEASARSGNGAQFLPILILLEAVAAILTIWHACHDKRRAAKMVTRAAQMPWAGSGPAVKVRAAIYGALPVEYRSPEYVDQVIQVAAEKIKSGQIPLD